MKFDHPPTADDLINAHIAAAEKDPASVYYKRILIKPKLHLVRVVIYLILTLAVCSGIGVLAYVIADSVTAAVISGLSALLLAVIIFARHIAIWLVRLYQNIAPASIRNRCRFEPSCSQYMIIALKKYGFFKGLKKGFSRLRRCKPPNGGTDNP